MPRIFTLITRKRSRYMRGRDITKSHPIRNQTRNLKERRQARKSSRRRKSKRRSTKKSSNSSWLSCGKSLKTLILTKILIWRSAMGRYRLTRKTERRDLPNRPLYQSNTVTLLRRDQRKSKSSLSTSKTSIGKRKA